MTDRRTEAGLEDRREGGLEARLDTMLDALRARPARLDELAQARVRARLEAAMLDVDRAVVRSVGRWRWRGRWMGVAGGVGLAAAAAVIAVVVAARTGGPTTGTTGPTATAALPAPARRAATTTTTDSPPTERAPRAISPPAPADPSRAAADSAAARPASPPPPSPVTVAAGESVQLALAGAAVTLYGPGRLSPTADGAIVDAAGMVVDRPGGDVPWSVHYRGMKIVVAHATFTLEGGSHNRVSVIRGEIELHCPSGLRTIRPGASAACEPGTELPARAAPRAPGASPRAAPPEAEPEAEPEAPEPSAPPAPPPPPTAAQPTPAELYATAESALRRGDLDTAQTALLALVDAAPDSLDAAVALVDLARLAANRGDTGRALGYLTRLERHPRRAWVAAPAALVLKSLARGDTTRALDPP